MLWISFILLTSTTGYINSQLTSQQLDLFRANNVTITNDAVEPSKYWIFQHHGVPSHDFGPFPSVNNPNTVSEQNHMYKIPKIPVVASTPGCLSLGTIAAAVNGVPFFNPYTATGYNAVEGSNREVFDNCTGHPAGQGAYHYHTVPHCLYTGTVDQFVGVAFDGYPIYGPKSAGGKMYTSSDLDACHGRTGSNNQYEYRLTMDYPYILGCYRGEATATVRTQPPAGRRRRQAGQRPPPGGQMPPPGGQRPGGQQPGGYQMNSCLYVTFCQNPANGCPCSAYTWDPVAPRTSTQVCNQTTTTQGSGINAAQCVGSVGLFAQLVIALLCACSLVLDPMFE